MCVEGKCLVVSGEGLPCQKSLFFSDGGEWWDHAGGHVFASVETWDALRSRHYDNTALLAGLPASSHDAADCTRSGFCFWRGVNDM
jgi:hypothetical protein